MPYTNSDSLALFTSEAVSMGHPDKVADQISDALLDGLLAHDPQARSAIETLVTTGLVVVAGEVTTHTHEAMEALSETEATVRRVLQEIGYDDPTAGFDYRSCAVLRTYHGQSPDISQGVTAGQGLHEEQGAGDQGMMFGFACEETAAYMPLPIQLSQRLVEKLADVRKAGDVEWLRPDSKAQVTIGYDGEKAVSLHTLVLSTQHDECVYDPKKDSLNDQAMQQLQTLVIDPVIKAECPDLDTSQVVTHINPTGKFVVGGPHGDTGLTGRKIIVDTYGGRGRHGGGAFSGKDPSKVDRSAAYMARHIAKNVVAAKLARQCEVQLAYAIGVAEPVSVAVDTFGSGVVSDLELAGAVRRVFTLTPAGIIDYLDLRRPIYFETARHGHFGREGQGFTWEKINKVDALKQEAGALQAG